MKMVRRSPVSRFPERVVGSAGLSTRPQPHPPQLLRPARFQFGARSPPFASASLICPRALWPDHWLGVLKCLISTADGYPRRSHVGPCPPVAALSETSPFFFFPPALLRTHFPSSFRSTAESVQLVQELGIALPASPLASLSYCCPSSIHASMRRPKLFFLSLSFPFLHLSSIFSPRPSLPLTISF